MISNLFSLVFTFKAIKSEFKMILSTTSAVSSLRLTSKLGLFSQYGMASPECASVTR